MIIMSRACQPSGPESTVQRFLPRHGHCFLIKLSLSLSSLMPFRFFVNAINKSVYMCAHRARDSNAERAIDCPHAQAKRLPMLPRLRHLDTTRTGRSRQLTTSRCMSPSHARMMQCPAASCIATAFCIAWAPAPTPAPCWYPTA